MRLAIQIVALSLFLRVTTVSAQTPLQVSALQRLSSAKIFAMGPVGFAYKTSQEEMDYRLILGQPQALASFEKLYADGNLQGKSYALAGIRELSPARFRELYAALPDSREKVKAMSGCILSDETLREVAQSLASVPQSAK